MVRVGVGGRFARGVLLAACVAGAGFGGTARGQAVSGPLVPVLDPQRVQDQEEMTWADYKPVPGVDWMDPTLVPSQLTIKVALIACDFEDQEFVITKPKGSDIAGNPKIDPVKREEVSKFYAEFWNGKHPGHKGHTVQEYWMQQSQGKIGVTFVPFGPYRMPKKLFQYGLTEYGARTSGPEGVPVNGNAVMDTDALWRADAGDVRADFNLVFRVYAGYDESSTWQEFGEMRFQDRDSIPAEFGNPDPNKPRWAPTRYVPWTSWWSAQRIWSNSSIIASENSGAILHEVSHAAFRIGDNNNNPYVTPYRRVGSGPWDLMDRGTFNGPGGPHSRWLVPSTEGGAMPAGLMLRQKIYFSFTKPSNVMMLSREGLAKSGVAVATVSARNSDPGETGVVGVTVRLDGEPVAIPAAALQGARGRGGRGGRGGAETAPATRGGEGGATTEPAGGGGLFPVALQEGGGAATAPGTAPGTGPATTRGRGRGRGPISGRGPVVGVASVPQGMTHDRTPWEDPATHPLSQGIPTYTYYSMEVVQRTGYDSFVPDNGVLIAKNKDNEATNGGPNAFNCFTFVIDAHPEDINRLDFKRPNGEPVMRTIADYRQLNDALFHAGLNSGSQSEYVDAANRLHFYIVDMKKDERGILSYVLAARSLDGAGPHTRGVELTAPPEVVGGGWETPVEFTLKNTGKEAAVAADVHPQEAARFSNADVYRLEANVEGAGWTVTLQNGLAAVNFGELKKVPVFVSRGATGTASATVVLKAVSESDGSKVAIARIAVHSR